MTRPRGLLLELAVPTPVLHGFEEQPPIAIPRILEKTLLGVLEEIYESFSEVRMLTNY